MRDRKLDVCLIVGLEERLSPHAVAPETVFAYELVSALATYSRQCGGFSLTVAALTGSSVDAPLIGVDPGALETASSEPLARYVSADVVYGQLAQQGVLDAYAIVHWLTPVVSPLGILARGKGAIVRTNLCLPNHPALRTSRALLGRRLREIRVGFDRAAPLGAIAPAVDLVRFRPGSDPRDKMLVALEATPAARAVAQLSGHELVLLGREPERALAAAAALLLLEHPSSVTNSVWAARALACGTPVIGWLGSGLEDYVRWGVSGALVPVGDVHVAAEEVGRLSTMTLHQSCRKLALARNGPRCIAAKHYEVYRSAASAK